jgi:hypothetical protein
MRARENEGNDEEGREGPRMQRTYEGIPKEEDEFGVFHGGRRYKR